MSTLVFDITQFFLLLNYCLFPLILNKVGFHPKVSNFFSDYLVSRKIQYMWNKFLSSFFEVDVSVRQGSALSSILSALYFSLVFHIFKKCVKNIKIPVSFLSFVNNRLFISQEKSFEKTNSFIVITLFLLS